MTAAQQNQSAPKSQGRISSACPSGARRNCRPAPAAIAALCTEIQRAKKEKGSWELAHLLSADGDAVQIIL